MSKDKDTKDAGAKVVVAESPAEAVALTPAPQPQPASADEVSYVANRPYSAGEPPDIVPARVKRQVGADPNILDLIVEGPGGEDVEVLNVRRSDRQEPGTWFEGGK